MCRPHLIVSHTTPLPAPDTPSLGRGDRSLWGRAGCRCPQLHYLWTCAPLLLHQDPSGLSAPHLTSLGRAIASTVSFVSSKANVLKLLPFVNVRVIICLFSVLDLFTPFGYTSLILYCHLIFWNMVAILLIIRLTNCTRHSPSSLMYTTQ